MLQNCEVRLFRVPVHRQDEPDTLEPPFNSLTCTSVARRPITCTLFMDLAAYRSNRPIRSPVEREFIIVGEASLGLALVRPQNAI
jgi:hypothetical protein